jgi:hypothetical protein
MSQNSPDLKFKGVVSVTGKFQFSVPSGNTVLLSPHVAGLRQFQHIHRSLVNCLCKKNHVLFSNATCLSLNIVFEHNCMKQINR